VPRYASGSIPWESFFKDQRLKDLINTAVKNNNDLLIAIKNIESSRLTLQQAKLGNLPEVNLGVSASLNRPSDNSLNGLSLAQQLQTKHVEDYNVAASISWEADIWGKIRSRKAAALSAYLSTVEAKNMIQTQLVNDISKGYFNLLTLNAQLKIAQQNVSLDDSTLSIIRMQFDAGQITLLAVQQAEAQKLSAASLVPDFQRQIGLQEDALSILCGNYPAELILNSTLENSEKESDLGAGVPVALLTNRPDVRESEMRLQEANAEVGYAKANMYPSLTITAQGGLDALKASNWFTIPASLFGSVAGSLTQPIFQRKKLYTAYQVSKVKRDQSVIVFRQSVLNATGEVSDALIKIKKLQEQRDIVTQRSATLKKAIGNAQLLFKNGMATYLEVLTAQANVLQSELELNNIKDMQLNAVVDLYRATGGGWR
jgi:NodT family efflux transporter outer membrane factor (OMF) lipoprotein